MPLTLTFKAGETAKTVEVAALGDARDEGSATLTLSLSNASGASIADGAATGTGCRPTATASR